MIKKFKPTTQEEWLKFRNEGIGSSDVGTILGYNKYEDFHEWWEYKTGRAEKEHTEAMDRGHFAEDFVARYFAHITNSEVISASAADIIYYDDEHPWRRATPDRFCWVNGAKHDPNNIKCKFILECKTYSGLISDGDYPKYWYTQVMYQIGVCGCDFAYLAWVDRTWTLDFVRIDFNQEEFDAICMAVDTAWEYNIQKDIEPEPTTYKSVTRKYKESVEGKSVEFDKELVDMVEELKSVKDQQKELDKREEELKNGIVLAMKDSEFAVDESGKMLCTFKHSKRFNPLDLEMRDPGLYNEYLKDQPKVFDASAFKKDKGSKVYAEYCTSIGPRTLKVK